MVISEPTKFGAEHRNEKILIEVRSYEKMAETVTDFVANKSYLKSLNVDIESNIPNGQNLYNYLLSRGIEANITNAKVVSLNEAKTTEEIIEALEGKKSLFSRLKQYLFGGKK